MNRLELYLNRLNRHSDLLTYESEYSCKPSDRDFGALGYDLMDKNKIFSAIQVFRYNVELYPESAEAYNSLGEAYMKTGNKEFAIENYEKSLKLNPNQTNAKERLKEHKKK
jgi:Flp pilus assembly protein TadD